MQSERFRYREGCQGSVKLFSEVFEMMVKDGVRIGGIRSETLMGLMLADAVFEGFGETMVVTSIVDGEHGLLSYHPAGFAFDLRRPGGIEGIRVARMLREALGAQFDVVLEETHIHIEFEVRRNLRRTGD